MLKAISSVSLLVALGFLSNCQTKHPDIRSDLQTLVDEGNPEMYYHWNAKRAEMYNAQADTSNNEGQRLILQFRYWTELLNSGQTEESIRQISAYLESEGGINLEHLNRGSKPIYDLLAVAYLRLGEQENCLANHTPS